MIIRKAKNGDAEGISNVLMQSYNIKTVEEGKEVFRKESKKDYFYIVAEEGGKIAGIVSWNMHGLPKHQLAELDRIAVLPEYRGKGIAKLLFEKLVADAKDEYKKAGSRLRKVYLMTHAKNERAQAFYKKLGFEYEATLKSHFYEGEDECVFSMFFS